MEKAYTFGRICPVHTVWVVRVKGHILSAYWSCNYEQYESWVQHLGAKLVYIYVLDFLRIGTLSLCFSKSMNQVVKDVLSFDRSQCQFGSQPSNILGGEAWQSTELKISLSFVLCL